MHNELENRMATIETRPEQSGYQLTDGSNGPTSSPVGQGASVGADISTIPDVNLYWILSNPNDPGLQSEIKVWLYDGNAWVPYTTSTLQSDDDRATLDAFRLNGGWSHIYVQITSPPATGTLDVYVTPHNM